MTMAIDLCIDAPDDCFATPRRNRRPRPSVDATSGKRHNVLEPLHRIVQRAFGMANRTLLRYFGLKQTAIVVFVGLGMLVHSPVPASAQPNPKSSADVTAQAEEFDRQKTELLKRLKELKSKIDGAGSIIDKKGNAAEAARESIQEMRAIVGPLLAAVADNGEVSQLSARTLKNAKDRKEMLERDTRFTPEERRRLV